MEHTSSLFNQNQNFKNNSNSIKPNTYIHMNIKNSKNKNNNLQKPLPNIVFFFFFLIVHSLVLFPFMFHQTFSTRPKYLSYMLTLNLIRKLYIPFVLKALQETESIEEIVQQSGVKRIIPKKNYLKYNIVMKS